MDVDRNRTFCKNCGAELAPGQKFCAECGSPRDAESRAGQGAPRPEGTAFSPPPVSPGGIFSVWMGMGMGMGSFVASNGPHFRLHTSGGMMMNSGRTYLAEVDGDTVTVRIRNEGVSLAEAPVFIRDGAFFDKIEEIFARYGAESWDGFNERDAGVMDGDSFSLDARLRSGASVRANGYMRYPAGYGPFFREIAELFTALYETRFPNYRRILDEYYEKELLPLYGDLTDGCAVEYGYLSEGNGQFSYGEDNVPGGVAARIVGNFHFTDRDRAARDMAVFFLCKRPMEDRGRNKTVLKVEFSTVDGDRSVRELGHAELASNLFWNDAVRARIFSGLFDGKFSIGYFSHRFNRFWEKPDTLSMTLFTFDGEAVSVAFSDEVSFDLSSVGDRTPTARDFPVVAPFLAALEKFGYSETAEKWRSDFSDPDLAGSGLCSLVRISTFSNTRGLYESLLETPVGERAPGHGVRGFIQPGM